MGASTIKGKVGIEYKKEKYVFEYIETKSSNKGAGPRGIKIWLSGEKGTVEYDIEPNPHDEPKYNKNATPLYEGLATQLASAYLKAENKWPRKSGSFKFGKTSFEASK